jgi:hypothetical protein
MAAATSRSDVVDSRPATLAAAISMWKPGVVAVSGFERSIRGASSAS